MTRCFLNFKVKLCNLLVMERTVGMNEGLFTVVVRWSFVLLGEHFR